jgi:excinuclease ABC subunit C
MTTYDTLKAAAHDAPTEPGVYLWKNGDNRIIYVGKAKVLRNRLSSYFSGTKDAKTSALLQNAASIETIITGNEYDALLLENTLIKQHYPHYNIALKNGSGYPLIKIGTEEFPRIIKTRRKMDDGACYFGPFPHAHAVDTMLALIDRLYPLRKCRVMHRRHSPCMYYHIGRCRAPCCGKISAPDYAALMKPVQKVLAGEYESLITDLTAVMHRAAAGLNFEKAAELRDTIRDIEALYTRTTVVDFDPESRDYIAGVSDGVLTTFAVFLLRGGALVGRELYRTQSAAETDESLETFLTVYYTEDRQPPARIYCEDAPDLSRWFEEHFGYVPALLQPDERRHEAVLAMARQNAQEDIRRRLKERGAGPALDELVQSLHLTVRPERIEGFDVAQLGGRHPVASLISFKNGIPDRKNYRVFKLRTVVGIVDDYAAIREAVYRRYSRLLREKAELPDLILIDGGAGQVNAAQGVLDELRIECAVVGLAKREEELWLPHTSEPLRLSRRSEGLKVLQFVRDETHRVATSLNQKLRARDICFSVLESVAGVGPARAAAILKAYPSLQAISSAEPVALAARAGLNAEEAYSVQLAAADAARRTDVYSDTSASIGAVLAAEAGNGG